MFLFIAVKLCCSLGAGFFRQDNISPAAFVFSPPVLFAKNALIDPHANLCRLAAAVQQYFAQKFSVASKLGPRCRACLLARGILWILYVFKCCIFSTCILPGRLEAEEAFSSEVKSSSLSPIGALFPLAALLVLNVQAMEKLWKNVEMQTDIFRQ